MTQLDAEESASDGSSACWCCGDAHPPDSLVHLGNHPEVIVCLGCAHFLHQQARAREDVLHPSAASRLRDGLRSARRIVLERRWHQKPIIGRVLRRLGRRLP